MANLTRRQLVLKYWKEQNLILNSIRGEIYQKKLVTYIKQLEKKFADESEFQTNSPACKVWSIKIEEASLLLSMINCKEGGKFTRGNTMIIIASTRYLVVNNDYRNSDFDKLRQFHIERTHTSGEAYNLLPPRHLKISGQWTK